MPPCFVRAALLCCLLLPAAEAAAAEGFKAPLDEAAIMLRLRQALQDTRDPGPKGSGGWADVADTGWASDDASPHCEWTGVRCNAAGQVTVVRLDLADKMLDGAFVGGVGCTTTAPAAAAAGDGPRSGEINYIPFVETRTSPLQLPPEMAQLAHLQELVFNGMSAGLHNAQLLGGIPPEWMAPTAFPRLKSLVIVALRVVPNLHGSPVLPELQRGALPALERLHIALPTTHVTLPASWGDSPAALPSLRSLHFRVQRLDGGLPASWSRGFRWLTKLEVAADGGIARASLPTTTAPAATSTTPTMTAPGASSSDLLPASEALLEGWASGFPQLEMLFLTGLGLTGPLPPRFPALRTLDLTCNWLSGKLPPHFLATRPNLTSLALHSNAFEGQLPPEWAASKVLEVLQLASNRLAGTAFPAAWLQPGAMPSLKLLDLSANPGITGTLPPNPPWLALNALLLFDTNLAGTIPNTWCQAPFAASLATMYVQHTGVRNELPTCAKEDMPRLMLGPCEAHTPVDPLEGIFYEPWRQQGQPKQRLVVPLAVLLPITAMAAAAAVLWRWRRQRRAAGQQFQNDLAGLLHGQPQQGQQGSQAPGEPAGRGAAAAWVPRAATVGRSRRTRLAAMLRAELGSRGGHSIEMATREALPAPVAHRLGATARQHTMPAPGACGAGAPPAEKQRLLGEASGHSALPSGSEAGRCRTEESWGWHGGSSNGSTGGTGEGSSSGGDSFSGRGKGSSSGGSLGMPAGAWQWGLPTESLRLGTGELELAVNPKSGAFVELGEGAHGSVFAAKLHGRMVACKVFELNPGSDPRAVWREASMLRVCSHSRIVQLLGVSIAGPLLLIAMELMKRGSLRDVLQHPQQREKLRWRDRGHKVAADVAEALDHLHTRLQVMHSDLKAANVLLSADYRASLADLGVAQVLHSTAALGLGFSSIYGAPEQLMGERCTEASDIYGFGVLLIELTTRQLVERRGAWRLPQAPEDCPQGVVDLINECVQQDPQRRPSAAQLRQRLLAEAGSADGGPATL